jgi:small-conductance mechanosensitive channel
MIVLALLFLITAWARFGWHMAAGFAFGSAIGFLNFHWLKRVVTALVDKVAESGRTQSSAGVIIRFLLRYVLMAIAAYVILSVSPQSLNGLFAGLFVPVAAIICEALYETYAVLARGA